MDRSGHRLAAVVAAEIATGAISIEMALETLRALGVARASSVDDESMRAHLDALAEVRRLQHEFSQLKAGLRRVAFGMVYDHEEAALASRVKEHRDHLRAVYAEAVGDGQGERGPQP